MAGTVNDSIMAVTGGPSYNDGLLAYYKAGGAPADSYLPDAEHYWLALKLGLPLSTSTPNADMWMQYLASYPGTLNDKWLAYWGGLADGLPSNVFNAGGAAALGFSYEAYDPVAYPARLAMWQDYQGVTPVTGVEQPVGLNLDLMGGYTYGPELVANGIFADGTTGWTPVNNAVLSAVGGELNVAGDGVGVARASTPVACTVGKMYEYAATLRKGTAATGSSNFTASANSALNGAILFVGNAATATPVTVRGLFIATASPMYVGIGNNVIETGTIIGDNISVREVTGRTGLVRGPQLVSNGTFDSGTTGWAGVNGTLAAVNGKLRLTNSASAGRAVTPISTVVGRVYEFTAEQTRISGVSAYANQINASNASDGSASYASVNITAPGSARIMFTATATTTYLSLRAGNADDVTDWDNVSVREVAGNHALQSTSTSRPILSARKNLLTKTEDLSDVVWAKALGVVTNNVFIPDATSGIHRISQSFPQVPTGIPVSVSGRVKPEGIRYIYINTQSVLGVGVCIDTQTGANVGAGLNFATANVVTSLAADGYVDFRYTGLGTNTAGNNIWFQANSTFAATDDNTYVGNNIAGLRATKIQVEYSSSATRYQRVNTATDYDYAGFPHYFKFDGVDDSWSIPTLDLTGTSKVVLFTGLTKLSDAAQGVVAEHSVSAAANNGTFALYAPHSAAASAYLYRSRGTAQSDIVASPYAAPNTAVLTGTSDTGAPFARLRANSTAFQDVTAQGGGNYGTYPFYIGRRAGTSLPAIMQLNHLTVSGAIPSAAQIAATEKYIANKMGLVT